MEETILFDFYISYRRGGLYSPLQKKFCIFKGALRFAFAEPSVNEAVYEGSATVEGMEAVLIKDTAEAKKVIDTGKVRTLSTVFLRLQ